MDGVEHGSDYGSTNSISSVFYIGGGEPSGLPQFIGYLKDVKMYDQVYTPNQLSYSNRHLLNYRAHFNFAYLLPKNLFYKRRVYSPKFTIRGKRYFHQIIGFETGGYL